MKNGLVISEIGTRIYYLNDRFHRENGPAIEYISGSKEYWIHGQLHREDGPAAEFSSGIKWYFLNNQRFDTEQDHSKEIKRRKSLNFIIENYISSI
jgi:hypothetical protein